MLPAGAFLEVYVCPHTYTHKQPKTNMHSETGGGGGGVIGSETLKERRTGSKKRRKCFLQEAAKSKKKVCILLFKPRKLLNHQQLQAGWVMNLSLQWSRSALPCCRGARPRSPGRQNKKRTHTSGDLSCCCATPRLLSNLCANQTDTLHLLFPWRQSWHRQERADMQSRCFLQTYRWTWSVSCRQTNRMSWWHSASSSHGTKVHAQTHTHTHTHTSRKCWTYN